MCNDITLTESLIQLINLSKQNALRKINKGLINLYLKRINFAYSDLIYNLPMSTISTSNITNIIHTFYAAFYSFRAHTK